MLRNRQETFFKSCIRYTIINLEVSPMCNSCNDRCGSFGSCGSIIWIIVLYFLFCDGSWGNCGCGCDNGCGNGHSLFGGSSCSTIIILILLFSCCCNGNGLFSLGNSCCCDRTPSCGCDRTPSCGCDRPSPCGCN